MGRLKEPKASTPSRFASVTSMHVTTVTVTSTVRWETIVYEWQH
jgi:hypothetical protein